MKRKLLITGGVLGGLLIIFFVVKGNKGTESSEILVPVGFGKFKVEIETTGELEAKNSTKILGPAGLRNYRIYKVGYSIYFCSIRNSKTHTRKRIIL